MFSLFHLDIHVHTRVLSVLYVISVGCSLRLLTVMAATC